MARTTVTLNVELTFDGEVTPILVLDDLRDPLMDTARHLLGSDMPPLVAVTVTQANNQ